MYFCRQCLQAQSQSKCDEGHQCENVDQLYELKIESTCSKCNNRVVRRIDWSKNSYPVKQKMRCTVCQEDTIFKNEVMSFSLKMDEIAYIEEKMMQEIDDLQQDSLRRKRLKGR